MKKMQPQERGLEEILGRAGDGICAIGPEGRVVLWNRAAEKILGWSARGVMGRPCCEVFRGADEHGNRLCYQGCHAMTLVKLGEPVQHFDMQTRTSSASTAGSKRWPTRPSTASCSRLPTSRRPAGD